MRAKFEPIVAECFGRDDDAIEDVDQRVARSFEDRLAIVWEGDAQTFRFSYVSAGASALLGYPTQRWIDEPAFWADVVIAAEDRDDAIAYCALATAKRVDHTFEYRARCADGDVRWLRDYVRVLVGPRGVAQFLRGIMFDVTDEKRAEQTVAGPSSLRVPSPDALAALP